MYHHLTTVLILLLTAFTTAVPINESDVVQDHSPTIPPTNDAPGYTGTTCDTISGRLHIYARYGSGLPNMDGWLAGNSDPYVRVIAYDHDGNSKSLRTTDDHGDESPEWNQWLDFGVDTWKRFTVQVFDEDIGRDDSLSSTTTYSLYSYVTCTSVRKNCDSGYIYFDYYFQP